MADTRSGQKPDAILHLCATCRPTTAASDRAALAGRLSDTGLDVVIHEQACMNACAAPSSLAMQADGRATYFFAGIDPVGDCEDIVATLKAYLASEGGWIEDARACGRLRHCLIGRVPAITPES